MGRNLSLRVGFVSIAAPFFDSSYPKKHYKAICERLESLAGVELFAPDQPVMEEDELDSTIEILKSKQLDLLLLQMGTFSTGIMPIRLCQSLQVPLALWALKEPTLEGEVPINSLCGVNLVSSTLHSLNRPYKFFYSEPDEDGFYQEFHNHVKVISAAKQMRKSRVGSVGGRAMGFYPCLYDELKLARVFGTEVLTVGLLEVLKHKVSVEQVDINSVKESLPTIEGGVLDKDKQIQQEMAFLTLKNFVEDQGFDALTLRDWPELTDDPDIGQAIWLAVGRLHDEVLITGPEGDMPGTLTMMIEEYLTAEKPFLCDMVYFDDEKNTVVLWHYGAAPSLARDASKVRYSEDNKEVEFTLREGAITMARLDETGDGYRMLITRGTTLDTEPNIRRAGAEVRLEANAKELREEIIYGGWAHHVCSIEGDHVELLKELCTYIGIEAVVL